MSEIDDTPDTSMPATSADQMWMRLEPVPNMLQIQMAVFVPGKGWLHTRRGIVTHGIIPPWSNEEAAVMEVKNGLRAMVHRAEND